MESNGIVAAAGSRRNVEGQQLPSVDDVAWAGAKLSEVIAVISQVVLGKESVARSLMLGILARGHTLLEDMPGVGKTLLARATAKALGIETNRVQFTPDIVPSDVTGTAVWNRRDDTFDFRPGPVFTNILLADEINRGTPRTQASLLEAMEERSVTVDGVCRPLPSPFIVVATQNPMEMHGTFPLPESQLDRFTNRLSLGYPDEEVEDSLIQVYAGVGDRAPLDDLRPAVSRDELSRLLAIAAAVYIGPATRKYLVDLVTRIRTDSRLRVGISPRGTLSLARVAQAEALANGRDSVLPDDIKTHAESVLAHRLVPHSHADDPGELVREQLDQVPVPVA